MSDYINPLDSVSFVDDFVPGIDDDLLGRFRASGERIQGVQSDAWVRFLDGLPTTTIDREDFRIECQEDLRELPEMLLDCSNSHFIVSNFWSDADSFSDIDVSMDANRIYEEPNAGGDSVESEALSLEFFCRSWHGKLAQTEMEIEYCPRSSKKTDYSIFIGGLVIGVSVTRAKGVFLQVGLHPERCESSSDEEVARGLGKHGKCGEVEPMEKTDSAHLVPLKPRG